MPHTTVSEVGSYRVDGAQVTFDCETRTDPPRLTERDPVPLTVSFYNPSTVRVVVDATPEAPARDDLPDYDAAAITEPVDLDVAERDDGSVVLATADLSVRVGRDPFSFVVRDAGGDVLYEAQTADVDVRGDPRVDPLWIDETEINHGPHRVSSVGTAFHLRPDERIYGLGEKFDGLDRVGNRYESWHVEPLGTETERAYKNVPFHLSSRGYGLLVDTTSRVRYDLGADSAASGQVVVDDDRLAFVLFAGPDFADVLSEYTAFTGRPNRPAKWSFGVWMSRLGYESRAELEATADRLRAERVPCDVLHLDPFWMREGQSTDLVWDREQFPDPEGMIEGLHDRGFHLSLWEHPHVPVGSEAFETAVDEGYLVTDGTGRPYVMDRTCQGSYRGGIVDFTDPAAVDWWQEKHRRLLEMGVDTFKTDYGEYVPEDAVFADGRSGAALHNVYPYLYNEAVFETLAEERGDDAFLWARSAWTGSQRYPVHWGGDPQTTFNGMAAALRGGLSASLSGFGFWSHDVGGFRGEPTPELYVRWAQFGLLSSHARCHGTTPREPWAFGDEALDAFRRIARLRYRLLPYIYTEAERTARTGLPVVRPLVLDFQSDPRVADLDDQFMLGPAMLVAPVFGGAGTTDVYLPAGEWVDHFTGERHAGGRTVTVETPLDRLPVFYRAGHGVPTREPTQTVQPGTPAALTVRLTLAAGGAAEATADFYDEDRDALVAYAAEVDGERASLSVETPETAVERETVVVDGLDAAPATVTVDGREADRVDADPASGEWAYVADADRVRVGR